MDIFDNFVQFYFVEGWGEEKDILNSSLPHVESPVFIRILMLSNMKVFFCRNNVLI